MAEKNDIDFAYNVNDRTFRLLIGETRDFSGAMYNGDFSLTLEEAQRQKHEYIYNNLNIQAGKRVLDMGCGWGPFLKFLKDRDVNGVGVTLSNKQVEVCRRNGLDVHLMDCRKIKPETFGTFDAVSLIGVFEAFCSKEEWKAGKQDEIYHNFFKIVYDLLPDGGRFYMQTETFGKNMIDAEDIDIDADKNSDAFICALMEKHYPGHWPPYGKEQIIRNAEPFFTLISTRNGRLDLIETQIQWQKRVAKFSIKKYLYFVSMIPLYITNKNFRDRLSSFWINANRVGLEREIIDQYRLVFEKKAQN